MRRHARWEVVAAIAVALLLTAHTAEADPLKIRGELPTDGGIAAIVWEGGSGDELVAAASARDCDVSSYWSFIDGVAVGYLPEAPPFVNAPFVAEFPDLLLSAGSILLLVCDSWSPPATLQQPPLAEPSPEGYSRDDWRHWIDADGDCQDTRQEVLIAESRITVTFESPDQCRVVSGEWFDPYTGVTITDPSSLDIDHMVPLAAAHAAGAATWDAAMKEVFANDLSDPRHLVAVTASANRSKGARGPEAWMPPRNEYWCRYAVDWVSIKNTWELAVTAAEWEALLTMLGRCAGGSPTIETQTDAPVACDPSYPDVCVPPPPPDLNCDDVAFRDFAVIPPDPHRFDGDGDGVGCRS